MKLSSASTSSSAQRRARTRSLLQLGGLLENAGTLEIFNIPLGLDLQSDPTVRNNIAALFKSFLIINDMIKAQELDLKVLALQGLETFKEKGLSETRPMDRKRYKEFKDNFTNDNDHEVQLWNSRLSSDQSDKFQDEP